MGCHIDFIFIVLHYMCLDHLFPGLALPLAGIAIVYGKEQLSPAKPNSVTRKGEKAVGGWAGLQYISEIVRKGWSLIL